MYIDDLNPQCVVHKFIDDTTLSGQIVKSEQGERFPLPSPFPSLPFPFSLPLQIPFPFPLSLPLPLEVGPLNPARGSGGAL